MMDGFTHYEGNAVLWTVYHNQGTTFVHATSEAIALQRFMAKYPDRVVKKIVRGQSIQKRRQFYFCRLTFKQHIVNSENLTQKDVELWDCLENQRAIKD